MRLEFPPQRESEKPVSNVIILLSSAGAIHWFADILAKPHLFSARILASRPQRYDCKVDRAKISPKHKPGTQRSKFWISQERLRNCTRYDSQRYYNGTLYRKFLHFKPCILSYLTIGPNSNSVSLVAEATDSNQEEQQPTWFWKSISFWKLLNFDSRIWKFWFHNLVLSNGFTATKNQCWQLCGRWGSCCNGAHVGIVLIAAASGCISCVGTVTYISKIWKHISSPSIRGLTVDRYRAMQKCCSSL